MKRHLKRVEQCAIAVGANHSRQVMTHCAERSDKKINILRTPLGLGQRKRRDQQQRCPDVQDQVPPGVQYPQLRPGGGRRPRRDSLQT